MIAPRGANFELVSRVRQAFNGRVGMKQARSIVPLFVLAGAATLHAGPAEEAIVGIMRLSEAPSYAWITTVSDDAQTYEIDGRTSANGFTHVKMPAINALRRRLGRDASDTRVEAIFRGNVDCVLRVEHQWLRPAELPPPEQISDFDRLGANVRTAAAINSSVATIVMRGSAARRPSSLPSPPDEEARGYTNLQFAICPPHEELGVIVSSHTDLKVDGELVTGTLTDLGAQLLLVRDGQKQIEPLRATGTFKIWLRAGTVTRYQLSLEGALSILSEKRGRITMLVHQRSLTEISEVGTARVEIPELARTKLTAN